MSLSQWGWSDFWAVEGDLAPARVVAVHREQYIVVNENGENTSELSGRLIHSAESALDLPATGDWVGMRHGIIDRVLPRRTVITRKAPGDRSETQVLAANVDLLLIVAGLDGDLNLRRLERYLVLALESGARPVFVLNKADLLATAGPVLEAVNQIAAGHEIVLASAHQTTGMDRLQELIAPGVTAALTGSSGVGKSTLTNCLLGASRQETHQVRESDSRGRHTTTHRQLFLLPGGGMLIDQPGLRELQLMAGTESVEEAFPEIAEAAGRCRFRDCRHQDEPGCAVREAVAEGGILPDRLASFHKLHRETERIAEEHDIALRLKRKNQIKRLCYNAREMQRKR